jgi:hypothetical protein
MSQVPLKSHRRAMLSGAVGIFASVLTLSWALFGYNLPSTLGIASARSQDLMLIQVGVSFVSLVASGLMLTRYPSAGGAINVLGSLATLMIGIVYTRTLELAARSEGLTRVHLEFTRLYTATLNIPVDRLVATFLVIPVFPIAILLLASGLGGLAATRH